MDKLPKAQPKNAKTWMPRNFPPNRALHHPRAKSSSPSSEILFFTSGLAELVVSLARCK